MRKILYSLVLASVVCGVSACSSMKKTLGIENSSPDEFMVTTRAPLTLPPDYDLRPLTGNPNASVAVSTPEAEFSKGEQALLSKLR